MKAFSTFAGLLIIGLLIITGCDSSSTTVDESPQDLLSLISQLETPGESLITSYRSVFVSEFEPKDIGRLPKGTHWGFLTPDDTGALLLGLALGKSGSTDDVEPPSDCELEKGGGLGAQRCLRDLFQHCDGAWTWKDDDGNTHSDGHNLVKNDNGNLDLVNCDLPDDDG